ncbi:MAG TPA: hypothetical protein PK986_05070 [Spirochaetota bacterium]|nr:hypothetical protein [Spirochaetota bacterium]HQO39822.1 hypothetical protein [Spirochaetota bacterium]
MKRILIVAAVLTAFLSTSLLYAKDGLNAGGGFKFIYAEDENVLQKYFKPFAYAGWADDFFDVNASYYRWISYSITDELLDTREIDIHQPGLGLSFYPGDVTSVDIGYSYFTGDSSYRAHRFEAGLMLDLEKSDISFDYSFKKNMYDFVINIENIIQNAAAELSFDINDSISWDLAYDYDRTDYKTFGYIYDKHTVRTGLLYIKSKNCFILGGISGSADSSNVASFMADAGFTLKLYDHVKLAAIYMLTLEFVKNTVSGGGPGSSTSAIDTSVINTGSISISLYL